jgi:hypothetical protein
VHCVQNLKDITAVNAQLEAVEVGEHSCQHLGLNEGKGTSSSSGAARQPSSYSSSTCRFIFLKMMDRCAG